MFIVSKDARKRWARKQLLTNPSLCMQYRNTHLGLCPRDSCFYTAYKLGNWSITITYSHNSQIKFNVQFLHSLIVPCTHTVFPRNPAAPRIVAAFKILPRSSNTQCTKRRPRILASCGKGSSLLRAYALCDRDYSLV